MEGYIVQIQEHIPQDPTTSTNMEEYFIFQDPPTLYRPPKHHKEYREVSHLQGCIYTLILQDNKH